MTNMQTTNMQTIKLAGLVDNAELLNCPDPADLGASIHARLTNDLLSELAARGVSIRDCEVTPTMAYNRDGSVTLGLTARYRADAEQPS